jgi:very-short-patch-repair endonuclease
MEHHRAGTTRRARALRRTSTVVEQALWDLLRSRRFRGMKFRRQFPIGKYIVDFVCLAGNLIIEADGAHHALVPARDRLRDEWLQSRGFTVLRFSNDDILTHSSRVLATIELWLPLSTKRRSRGVGEGVGG